MLRLLFALLLTGVICTSARADEPKKTPEAEKIPAPKVQIEPPIVVMPYVPRSDTRDVWQHYGVNAQGRFVPRVIVLPFGAYYSRNLEPYPWTPNRPTAVLPRLVN
jgi:hypothetical protein